MDFQEYTAEEVEEADFRQVANPLGIIVLPEGCTRAGIVEHLSRYIPSNDYGLPTFFIRTDLLDVNRLLQVGSVTQDEMECAAEPLLFVEGYPTFGHGSPFWTQLPHETHEDYLLFKRFLELAEDEGIRLIDTLAHRENVLLERVRQCQIEYYWSSRARAYDLFIVAADAKRREARARKATTTHFEMANVIIERIWNKVNSEPELIEKMGAEELFNLLGETIKIQRASLGLTGQGANANQVPANPGQTVEVILRQLTQATNIDSSTGDALHQRLAMLMSDPSTAMKAQELIIRTTAPSNKVADTGDGG